jgi:hypothetical protein
MPAKSCQKQRDKFSVQASCREGLSQLSSHNRTGIGASSYAGRNEARLSYFTPSKMSPSDRISLLFGGLTVITSAAMFRKGSRQTWRIFRMPRDWNRNEISFPTLSKMKRASRWCSASLCESAKLAAEPNLKWPPSGCENVQKYAAR